MAAQHQPSQLVGVLSFSEVDLLKCATMARTFAS